jgi:hypothetical protein
MDHDVIEASTDGEVVCCLIGSETITVVERVGATRDEELEQLEHALLLPVGGFAS